MSSVQHTLQLQLDVGETLIRHTTRESIGLELADAINRLIPFRFFLHSIWFPNHPIGYRISAIKNTEGRFAIFDDRELWLVMAENRDNVALSGEFLMGKQNSGIYQGEALKRLCDRFASFRFGYNHHGIRSLMFFNILHDNGFNNVFILSDTTEHAFRDEDYEIVSSLLPQIQLAYENLFKYEKLKQEETERNLQLGIMTAFNDKKKDPNEMSLAAISRINEIVSFDYWFNITNVPKGKDMEFRLAYKNENRFLQLYGDELFKKLNIAALKADSFKGINIRLYEKPSLFTGEEFDELKSSINFFDACHKNFEINSAAILPLATQGEVNTIVVMGSKRKYAFTQLDMEVMTRTLPYIAMVAQQYYSLYRIQSLRDKLELEKNYLEEEIKSDNNFDEIIGSSAAMQEVFTKVSQVAPTTSTVLILGETGTGKELIARAIHNQSPRKSNVLVKINCASLPAQLIESELFGHEKGSFTGAFERRIGKFELAHSGTIFLDEIGELPLELQAKLLRVLQEREIERIGGKNIITLDVRVIAATNRNLENEVLEGRFRSDLFYRLSVFPISLPPLRQRQMDIPLLTTHFLQRFSKKFKRPYQPLQRELMQELTQYEWPGNIRELENVMEQAIIVGDASSIRLRTAVVKKSELKERVEDVSWDEETRVILMLTRTKGKIFGPQGAAALLNLRPSQVEEYERKWILDALQKTAGRIRGDQGAAELMGIRPTTLEARVKKLKIQKTEIFKN